MNADRIRQALTDIDHTLRDVPTTAYQRDRLIRLREFLVELQAPPPIARAEITVPATELNRLLAIARILCEYGTGDHPLRDELRRAGKAFDAAMTERSVR